MFGNARVVLGYSYGESKSSSESWMGSGTSQGALEWFGGDDLCMGSHIQGSRKCSGFFGIVLERFYKFPEWGPPACGPT